MMTTTMRMMRSDPVAAGGFLCRGRARVFAALCALLFFAVACAAGVERHPLAGEVVIVANRAVEGSDAVARYYAERRGIDPERIILLDMPDRETISRAAFNRRVLNPLVEALDEGGFMDVVLERAPADGSERRGYSVVYNHVRYIVLCYGVPLRIARVNDLEESEEVERFVRRHARTRPNFARPEFFQGRLAANNASVDSELATLAMGPVPVTGMVGNPVFRQIEPGVLASEVIRVARLDGPTPADAKRLVDQALEGERLGLRGRAYFDEDGREEGGYRMGNDWLRGARRIIEMAGFDTTVDTRREIFDRRARFDAPAFYLGWYANDVDGVFLLEDFKFAAGAVAAHIHSFSARSLRDAEKGWAAPFVRRGAAATVGNVYEPYLMFSHHLDALTGALLDGWTWGDAAYFALPVLSWQNVTLGDPLYRPFAVPLEAQIERIRENGWDGHDAYILIRATNRLRRDGREEEAREGIRGAFAEQAHPGLALYLVEMLSAHEERDERQAVLRRVVESGAAPERPTDWGLFAALAEACARERMFAEAVTLYQRVLESAAHDEGFARAILGEASRAAASAGDSERSMEWRDRQLAIIRAEEAVSAEEEDGG